MNLSIVSVIFAGLAGLIAWFFKNKADRATAQVIESKVAIQDAPLAQKQADDKEKIKEVDAGIQAIKDEREKMRNQYLTDQQRADSWTKPKS